MSTSSAEWEKVPNDNSSDDLNDNQNNEDLINQQINDQIIMNQQLNDENNINKQPDNQTSTSEASLKINQINEIIYELDWTTQNELISYLNYNSSLLFGKSISSDKRVTVLKKNVDFYDILTSLPLKSLKSNENRFSNDEITDDDHSNKIVLDLNYDLRSKIIEVLVANRSLVNLHGNSAINELKMQLINKNNDMINSLLQMGYRIVGNKIDSDLNSINSNGTDSSKGNFKVFYLINLLIFVFFLNNQGDNQLVKRSELDKEIGLLKDKLQVKTEQNDLMNKELQEMKENYISKDDMQERMNEMQKRIEDVVLYDSEITFGFEFDVNEFLESKDFKQESELFYCGGINWYLLLNANELDKKHLSFFLYSSKKSNVYEWSININYEFRIINQLDKTKNKTVKLDNYLFENKTGGYGYLKFITKDELTNDGFVKDGKIKAQVYLKTDKFSKTSKAIKI